MENLPILDLTHIRKKKLNIKYKRKSKFWYKIERNVEFL